MRRRSRAIVAVAAVAALVVPPPVVHAEPIGEPIEIEIDSPAPGLPDLPDPPLIALPDLDTVSLDVPRAHPWMLFDDEELPALRERILGAAPDSVVGQSWDRLVERLHAPDFTDRASFLDGLADLPDRRWGRDDLLLAGFAWHITEDPYYLDLARGLLSYAVALTPDYGAPIEPGVDEFYIQRAHRLNGFALAYDLLRNDLQPLERVQLRTIVETLGAQHFVHANTAWWGLVSSGSNIGGNNAAALGTAGLALWHDNPLARTWVLRAEQIVRSYFHEGFDTEGAGIEGVLYANYGMRIPTYLGHALTRAGFPHLFDAGGIPHQQAAYAYDVLPGGGAVNPVNDARYYEINPTYTTWQIAHGANPDLSAWLFDNMTRKVPGGERSLGEPVPTLLWYSPSDPAYDPAQDLRPGEDFRRRGYVVSRGGWEPGDFMASFEVRETDWGEGVHQNQDVTSITLYDGGAKLIVDSRYGNFLSKLTALDFDAVPTSESQAHNVVVADGRTQNFFGKGDLTGFASLASIEDPGPADIAAADARLAWLIDQPQQADRFFLHTREATVDGHDTVDYLVTADRFVQGNGAHDYTSFLHTDWRNTVTADADDPGRFVIASGEVPGVELTVDAHTQGGHRSVIDEFTPDDAQDWDRLGQPGRKAQPRISLKRHGHAFRSISVLIPTEEGEPVPAVERSDIDGGVASVVTVADGVTDTLLLADGSAPTVAGHGIETDADFASIRRSAHGVEHIALTGGTFVDVDGVRLLSVDGGPATLVADADGVAVDGAAQVDTTPPATEAASSDRLRAPTNEVADAEAVHAPATDSPSAPQETTLPATGGSGPLATALGLAAISVVLRRRARGAAHVA